MDIPADLNHRVLALEKHFANVPSPLLSLIGVLPPADAQFSFDDRIRWLRAFEAMCNVVYENSVHISIPVNVIER